MNKKRLHSVVFCLAAIFLVPSAPAWAWGVKGHAIVAQVAVRHLLVTAGADQARLRPFDQKELMLAHLSNAPDTAWKGLDKEVVRLLNPTHWFNLELFLSVDWKSQDDLQPLQVLARVRRACEGLRKNLASRDSPDICARTGSPQEFFLRTGSAPWRVGQFYHLLVSLLRQISPKGSQMNSTQIQQVDQALIAAGLMSHFVGDLAQPLHTTADFDGYRVGQGGLHSFFESELVDAADQDLSLAAAVFRTTTENRDALIEGQKFKKRQNRNERNAQQTRAHEILGTPLVNFGSLTALKLGLDSAEHLGELYDLDRNLALIAPSRTEHGLEVPARRRPAAIAAPQMRQFLIKRLAAGSLALSRLIRQAWAEAGQPDLSGWRSVHFELNPSPVPVLDPFG